MGELNGVEIPDEMLESIAGGQLDDNTISNLKALVAMFKANGKTLDDIISALSYLQNDKGWAEMVQLMTDFFAAK